MTTTRITVSRWTAEDDDPTITTFDQLADGSWQSVSDPTAPPRPLDDVVFVDTDGAIHVTTIETDLAPDALADTLAAALPQSAEYLEWVHEIETGDEVLDAYFGSGIPQVAIDGQRWAAFPLSSDGESTVIWLQCDPDQLDSHRAIPLGTTLCYAAGIETASMCSGVFSWSLIDVGAGNVCFVDVPDESPTHQHLEPRNGRTNRELAEAFVGWVEWNPVADAVARAIELGGEFDGVASDLDESGSDTCEVCASVELEAT